MSADAWVITPAPPGWPDERRCANATCPAHSGVTDIMRCSKTEQTSGGMRSLVLDLCRACAEAFAFTVDNARWGARIRHGGGRRRSTTRAAS